MQIKLEHLTKRFGDTVAVNDLSITLESGKLIALLGPSGCGKTTTLNMISGILPVSGGSIFFDDRDVTSLPPEKRGIGLVFQNYALYPHMTVLQNICFPMEIQRIPKKERIRRAEELAEMFQRSRPVVREALRMLQQEGLIETAVGSSGGAVIRGVSLKSVEEPLKNLVAMGAINLDELLEYRHINDRSCARLAAIHHTEEDAEALRQTLEGAKANLDSLFSFQEYDVAFHSALAKASHNTLASLINDVIVRLNTDVFVETIRDYTPEQLREINLRIYNTHYAIMEAVLAHDPDGADRAVAAMVRLFQDTVH